MARKAKQPSFSPAESAHLKNLSAQTGGEPTDFDDEMQEHLEDHIAHEANAAKMHAAQAGSSGLGPSSMDTEAVKQRGALQQQSDMAGAQAAMQAQGQQTPVTPPAAPTGPVGTSGLTRLRNAHRGRHKPPLGNLVRCRLPLWRHRQLLALKSLHRALPR